MAKGTTIGFLNFGIDGDNKELLKKLEQARKEAVSIEQIFKNIKLNTGGNSISTDVQKASLAADKLAKSQNQVTQSAMNVLKAEQQLETAITNENNAKARGLVIENQRQAALQKSLLYAKQGEAVSANQVLKETAAKQKLIYEEERLTGLHKRNSLIGVQGQKDLAAAYGLTNKTMFSQNNLLQQLSSAAGIYFSVYQVAGFIKELATVSGEFEKQRVSLAAIIGDADAANKIFNQIKDLAVISPFNFTELTNYAKQLSAFSIPTNEIYDTTKRLADLSAGLGVDMSRIILAYGQVRSAAVLRGQELRQFTEAGIPLVDELAKKFGELEGRVVSAGEVFEKISNRQASFGMVKEIMEDLTNEGGKFFKMQELQSETVAGKISNLRDNYDMMLDSLGRANSGILHGGMDGLVELMDNWKSFVNILYGVIAAYGVYKTAVIFNTAIRGKANVLELQSLMTAKLKEASLLRQASVYRTLTAQEQIRIATSNKLTTADLKQLAVSGSLNKESVLRLIATKQITVAQAGHLKTVLGITKAEIAQAAAMSASGKAALFLKTSLMGVATSLKAIAMNPYTWVIAAIGGIVYALSEWNDKQKEIEATAKTISDGVISSYKTISEALKKLTPDIEISLSTSATDKGILQTVEKLRNALSDLVPKDIFSNIISELDKIPNSSDKVKFLNSIFIDIRDNAEKASKGIDALSSNAMDATDGWFDDSLVTNVKEYTKALLSLKKADGKMKSGQANNKGWFDLKKKQSNEAKESVIEDLKAWSELIQKDMFPSVQDWSKNPNLSYGSQVLLSELRDKLIKGIEGISPDVSDEITKMFNKTFWISPEIKITQQSLSTFQTAVQQAYNSLNSVNTFSLITDNPQISLASIMPQQEERAADWLSRVTGLYTDAKEQLDLYNSSLLANKIIFDDATVEGYKKQLRDIPELIKAMGMSMPSKNKGGSTKDEFAEKLKKRIDLLKEARSEYDKLVKAGVSEEEAATKISKLDSFGGVDPRQYNSDIDKIISDLQKKGEKIPKEQEEILRSLILNRDTEGLTKYAEQLSKDAKAAIDKIEKYLSNYKTDFDFYKRILGITGDKGQAAKLAFGADNPVKEYINVLKEAFKKSSGVSFSDFIKLDDNNKLKLLVNKQTSSIFNQIEAAEKDEVSRRQGIYAESLKEFASYQNKRLALQYEYDEKIKIAEENGNKGLADGLRSSLSSELLKLTPDYQKFFTSIYSLTQDKAIQIGNLIKTNLKEQLDKGVISTQDYYEGIKKINDELKKSQKGIDYLGKLQSGGIEGLFGAMDEKASSDYQSALIDRKQYQEDYNEALKVGDLRSQSLATSNMQGADGIMKGAQNMQSFIGAAQGAIGVVDKIVVAIDQSVRATQQIVDQFAELAESRGIDTDKGTWGDIKGLMNVMSEVNAKAKASWDSAKSGDAAGALANTVGIVTSGLTALNAWHDKKLNKTIEESVFRVKQLQQAYKALEYEIENTYGEERFKKTGDLTSNLYSQQIELQRQLRAEQDKKKKDKSAIEDYKEQIAEIDRQIKDLFKSIREEILGTSESAASNLANSLVDAFKNGESAAKAWGNTVDDIIDNIIKNIIATQYILPKVEEAFKNFWDKSMGGTDEDRAQVAKEIAEVEAEIDAVNNASSISQAVLRSALEKKLGMSFEEYLAILEEYLAKLKAKQDLLNNPNVTVQNIEDLKEDLLEDIYNDPQLAPLLEYLKGNSSKKDTLSKGIQSITEDTGDILASYMNAMRADLAAQKQFVQQLVSFAQLHTDQFANMYAELLRIQVNTLATANNTAVIAETTTATYNLLRQATVKGSGTAINLA